MTDGLLSRRCRVDGVVTTVDALNGGARLDADFVSVKQAAIVDRIALTKTDFPFQVTQLAGEACLLSIKQVESENGPRATARTT